VQLGRLEAACCVGALQKEVFHTVVRLVRQVVGRNMDHDVRPDILSLPPLHQTILLQSCSLLDQQVAVLCARDLRMALPIVARPAKRREVQGMGPRARPDIEVLLWFLLKILGQSQLAQLPQQGAVSCALDPRTGSTCIAARHVSRVGARSMGLNVRSTMLLLQPRQVQRERPWPFASLWGVASKRGTGCRDRNAVAVVLHKGCRDPVEDTRRRRRRSRLIQQAVGGSMHLYA